MLCYVYQFRWLNVDSKRWELNSADYQIILLAELLVVRPKYYVYY